MPNKDFAIFINADGIGRGDDGLGQRQMAKFLGELSQMPKESLPGFICLMNAGVKIACTEAAPVPETLEYLAKLAEAGAEILVCGTCLEFFGLKEKVSVGRISNITEITTVLAKAGKVLTV